MLMRLPHRPAVFAMALSPWALAAAVCLSILPAGATAQPPAGTGDAAFEDDEFGGTASAAVTAGKDEGATAKTEMEGAAGKGAAAKAPAPSDAERKVARRARRAKAQNSLRGAVGGFRAVDAGSGATGTFRLQLHTNFSFVSDFLNDGDKNDLVGGALSLSASIFDFLEIYASIGSSANSNNTESPELFQVLGDTNLGVKGFVSVLPWLTVGGDVELSLLNGVGDLGLALKGTSVGIRGNATADFRDLEKAFPLIGRFNLQYYVDNSANLVSDVEDARYDALVAPAPKIDESRHLLTRVERFALGINRTDFLNLTLGFEAPLEVATDFTISPLLEWNWAIPVNRQGYDCLFVASKGVGTSTNPDDSCLDVEGAAAFPMDLTFGVRVLPPVPGLSLFAGVDIGLTGTSTFVRELAGNAPYNVFLGLGYAYDTAASREQVVRVSEVVVTQAPEGHVRGTVVEADTNPPMVVRGAAVRFTGDNAALTALLAGDDGKFTTYSLSPGEVVLDVSHPDFESGSCRADVPPDGDVDVVCALVAKPRNGAVSGRVTDDGGNGVAATMTYSGPAEGVLKAESNGMFSAKDLPPGLYSVRVEGPATLANTDSFEILPRETITWNVNLAKKPAKAAVEVQDGSIKLRKQINFGTGSDEINPNSDPLLGEIADAILRNPQIRRIEIQGHTDNVGGADKNKSLSQARANAVRANLIQRGVGSDRLTAVGHGMERPIAPNITASNRARNRRVEFIILERSK